MANNFLGTLFFGDCSSREHSIPTDRNTFSIVGDLKVFYRGYIANIGELPFSLRNDYSEAELFTNCFAEAYKKWGIEVSKFVLGEFALAIIDTITNELFLTHDMLGVCPLFYCEVADGVVFSSSLQMIVQGKERKPIMDEEYIADFLAYGDHYGNRTVYRNIKRLTAGESVL